MAERDLELELRDANKLAVTIEERNAAVNRRTPLRGGGGVPRVTDPSALARLMAEMQAKAEEQKRTEHQREQERQRREGATYRPPEQRLRDAQHEARVANEEASASGEAQVLEKRFDPKIDFYRVLGVDRASSFEELKKAFKRLALLYHPDKFKGADIDQQAAVADKFKQVAEAFDVLSDERQRAVYDKVLDYREANPGAGLPALSPGEAALMRTGIAELSRLRRQGAKLVKHKPLEREVFVSLERLNAGCTKTLEVERQRVHHDGTLVQQAKRCHLIIRRGSQDGNRLVFDGDGEETPDTLPGDLVIVLRQKPHSMYKRTGYKDLSMFAGTCQPGDVLFARSIVTLRGARHMLHGSAFLLSAAAGGSGGVLNTLLEGHGLYDPQEPWDKPAGNLHVELRFPAFCLDNSTITSCLRLRPVYAVASAQDTVAAVLASSALAAELAHQQAAAEMAAESCQPPILVGCCLSLGTHGPTRAAEAAMQVLQQRVPRLVMHTICAAHGLPLLDCELGLLENAGVLVLDGNGGVPDMGSANVYAEVRQQLEDSGAMSLLWSQAWQGCRILAVADGCELLGKAPSSATQAVLPLYVLQPCCSEQEWGRLQTTLTCCEEPLVGVALLKGSSFVIDAVTGAAELITAPCPDVLAAAAAWEMGQDVHESENDYGFLLACST